VSVFIIGFPGAVACRVAQLLDAQQTSKVALLVAPKHQRQVKKFIKKTGVRVSVVEGTEQQIDFGLSGDDYRTLAKEVTTLLYLKLPGPPGHPKAAKMHEVRTAVREIVELGLVSDKLKNILMLSHLDVAGNTHNGFVEQDLEQGQSFNDPAQADRLSGERVLRRFMNRLPITVVRCGWVVGEGDELCPLGMLLLAAKDTSSLPVKNPMSQLQIIDIETISHGIAKLAFITPRQEGETLHFLLKDVPHLSTLMNRVHAAAEKLVPGDFDLVSGARRALRKDELPTHRWSARNFFKRQPYDAKILDTYTERFLLKHRIESPRFDKKIVKQVSQRAVEKIAGFK
jgi:nucleoside-diphosphate-sugar epimerase